MQRMAVASDPIAHRQGSAIAWPSRACLWAAGVQEAVTHVMGLQIDHRSPRLRGGERASGVERGSRFSTDRGSSRASPGSPRIAI
jgi:hypothetical protein